MALVNHTGIRLFVSLGFIVSSAAMTGAGCGSEGTGKPNPIPAGCVPSDAAAAVGDECGVFVDPSGSDADPGTKAKPVATMAKAIELAGSNGRVYACAETFAEAVEVPAGIAIFGGLSCADRSWKYMGADKKTTFAPGADKVPLTFKKGAGTSRAEDIVAMAVDATLPGGSSIAAIAEGVSVEMFRSQLIAGAGAAGAKGETPAGEVQPSSPDATEIVGNAGNLACTGGANGNPGGAEKQNEFCPDSKGGAGGSGKEAQGDPGATGVPTPEPNPNSFGVGGLGGMVSGCTAGTQGDVGAQGAPGNGGMGLGTLDAKGIVGAAGNDGAVGAPGQGGGGGGGAKGKPGCYGASGGSGGAGGCGGGGGKGGQAGGSSIALVSVNATFSFEDVELVAGAGGKGGEGGDGQVGGVGGAGGKGGAANGIGTTAACSGGDGGFGGTGGRGGGGVGGHSIGIAYVGTAPAVGGATITAGTAGEGGLGEGSTGIGAPGMKADTQAFGD